ncbi:MAG: hypothetical protein AB7U85_06395 [Alphaproteobacteria bacterium]
MAESEMSKEVMTALEDYFNSPIQVYECGSEQNRPERIQDRPFLKTLPDGHTVYVQKTSATKSVGSFALSLDKPIIGGSIAAETENSKFLQEMQERFRNAKEDVNLIIIDPDVIRGRYAMDENPRRTLFQSFYEYLHGNMEQDGVSKAMPLSKEDYGVLMESAILGNSPLSLGVPIKGLGQYAIVISSQPDMPMHDMFTSIPGSEIRMEHLKIGKEHVRDMILLHELGHALDTLNKQEDGDTIADDILKRHRTECVADVHATLQTAKKYGSTDVGKLVSDIRIDNTVQGIAYIQRQLSGGMGLEGDVEGLKGASRLTLKTVDNVLREDFEKQKYFASPELKAFVEAKGAEKKKASGSKKVSAPKQPSAQDVLENIEQSAQLLNVAEVLGSISSYTTSFCADAAVKIADKKLKDGSLAKMTDKEIHKLAEEIVAKEAFDKAQITGLVMGMITGEETPEFIKIVDRYQEATTRFPEDKKKQAEAQMAAMGFPVPKPKLTPEETVSFKNWWEREMAEKIEAKGSTREALLGVVEAEKDEARKADTLYNQYKIAVMNQLFMENPDRMTDKAKTFGTVRDTLKNIEAPVVEEKGLKAVAAFVETEMKALDTGLKAVELAEGRNIASMSPEVFAKTVSKESRNLKKLYEEQKKLQALAFAIRKDPEAWEAVSKTPLLAQKIEEQAKQKHPVWVEGVHLNLGQNTAQDLKNSKDGITLDKKVLASCVLQSEAVSGVVAKTTLKKLENELPQQQGSSSGLKSESSRKKREYTESEGIRWNLLNKTGRSK